MMKRVLIMGRIVADRGTRHCSYSGLCCGHGGFGGGGGGLGGGGGGGSVRIMGRMSRQM